MVELKVDGRGRWETPGKDLRLRVTDTRPDRSHHPSITGSGMGSRRELFTVYLGPPSSGEGNRSPPCWGPTTLNVKGSRGGVLIQGRRGSPWLPYSLLRDRRKGGDRVRGEKEEDTKDPSRGFIWWTSTQKRNPSRRPLLFVFEGLIWQNSNFFLT